MTESPPPRTRQSRSVPEAPPAPGPPRRSRAFRCGRPVVIPGADCHTPFQSFTNPDKQQPASACPERQAEQTGPRQSRQPASVCGTPPEAAARTFLCGSYHVLPGSAWASAELGLPWGPSQEALGARTPTGQPRTQLKHYPAVSRNDTPEEHTGQHRSPTNAHPAL